MLYAGSAGSLTRIDWLRIQARVNRNSATRAGSRNGSR